MLVLPATDDLSAPLEPLRVSVVTTVTTPTAQAIVAELRREAMAVEVVPSTVIDAAPTCPVYIVCLTPTALADQGPRFVDWAAGTELRAGLIGVVDGGTTEANEELLAIGFDDVVATPVSTREVVARVKAVHRRVFWKGMANGRVRFADLTLDVYGRELWIDGKTIALTSIELSVLRELIKARGKPLSRAELLDLAWGDGDLEVSERAVDNVILRLRRKLPSPDLIETVRSVGFRIADRS